LINCNTPREAQTCTGRWATITGITLRSVTCDSAYYPGNRIRLADPLVVGIGNV